MAHIISNTPFLYQNDKGSVDNLTYFPHGIGEIFKGIFIFYSKLINL